MQEQEEPFGWDTTGYEKTFVENLKALRTERGMSQSSLARFAHEAGLPFHQPTIQRIESGERPVKLTEAIVLAGIFGTDLPSMMEDLSVPVAYEALVRRIDPDRMAPNLRRHVVGGANALYDEREEIFELFASYVQGAERFGIAVDSGLVAAAESTLERLHALNAASNALAADLNKALAELSQLPRAYPAQWPAVDVDDAS